MTSIVWLRRDLRLYDHAALSAALLRPGDVQLVFVFDSEILARFVNPEDRRLSFIAEALRALDNELRKRGGGLLVLHGKASEVIPKLATQMQADVFAAEDYEAATRKRDTHVSKQCKLTLVKDHLIFAPAEIVKDDGTPYKVFTPYAKQWRLRLTPGDYADYTSPDKGRYADIKTSIQKTSDAGLKVIPLSPDMLSSIGYKPADISQWPVAGVREKLADFMSRKAVRYKESRNMMAVDGTSRLSPYFRFGLVSIRETMRLAMKLGMAETYISELIWREFYAMILYHYPESAQTEWNPKYRAKLAWRKDGELVEAWKQGKTGYPVVDAAMRELLTTGWMHNRARMIVASFATKDLLMDWRVGEEFFAQHLMDYELASNVGGWQWSASTGTDAQPWFRIFNPYLQSEKFDPKGEYIRRYVPELSHIHGDDIHKPPPLLRGSYPAPIVDHGLAREKTLAMFKSASD